MKSFISNLKFTINQFTIKTYLGGYSSEVPPLPIPNREVKLANADGTADMWKSR